MNTWQNIFIRNTKLQCSGHAQLKKLMKAQGRILVAKERSGSNGWKKRHRHSLAAITFSHILSESQHLVSGPPAIVWSLTNQLGVVCLLFKLARQVPIPMQSQPRLQDGQSRRKLHPPCSDTASANTWHARQTSCF